MNTDIAYRFDRASLASRFLAEIESETVPGCRARRYQDDCSVLVTYSLTNHRSQPNTAQKLDDLAESLGGYESSD